MREKTGRKRDTKQDDDSVSVSKFDETYLRSVMEKRRSDLNAGVGEPGDLIGSLNNSYSLFFRNTLTFEVLGHIVLPSLLRREGQTSRHEIRVWSAACAAGQEPYSLAMLLEELPGKSGCPPPYRIFATDHDARKVEEAARGVFLSASLKNVPLHRFERWFSTEGGMHMISQDLRRNIVFSAFDLFDPRYSSPPDSIFGDFDLVVCANILFYYKPEYRKMILDKAGNSLAPGGFLVTGESERSILTQSGYREIYEQSCVFQRI